MAEDGFWAEQFRRGAPEAVAKAWVGSGANVNAVLVHASRMSQHKLISKTGGSWKKDEIASAVISDMKLVPKIIKQIQREKSLMSGPILAGLEIDHQIDKTDAGAKKWLDEDPDHVIFYGPYSSNLEVFLVREISKVLVESDWYKKNISSIRKEANKYNAVNQVMAQ